MSLCFIHLGGTPKEEFDMFQVLCQVFVHVCLAQYTSGVFLFTTLWWVWSAKSRIRQLEYL